MHLVMDGNITWKNFRKIMGQNIDYLKLESKPTKELKYFRFGIFI